MFKTKIKKIYNPLIIAEIGNNFEGNLKIAKKIIATSKKSRCGCSQNTNNQTIKIFS